jgi:glutathione peroxidase
VLPVAGAPASRLLFALVRAGTELDPGICAALDALSAIAAARPDGIAAAAAAGAGEREFSASSDAGAPRCQPERSRVDYGCMPANNIQQIPLQTIDGTGATLGDYQGDVLLVVNVASKCGLTPQYEALEAVHERFRDQGFAVLGFPANDFGGQEPGTNEEISEFCSVTFGVQFPMFAKIAVTGQDKHPLYTELTSVRPEAEGDKAAFRANLQGYGMTPTEDPEILWNFEKFLLSRDGAVVARFSPDVTPDDERVTSAIERELTS